MKNQKDLPCSGQLSTKEQRSLHLHSPWAVLLIALPMIVCIGAVVPSNDKVISAEEFILHASDGTVRASLSVDRSDTAIFTLYDGKSNDAIKIGVGPTGRPTIAVLDPEGDRNLTLAFNPLGDGGLTMYDSDGITPRLRLWTERDGDAAIEMRDSANAVLYKAP
jgi:hypothetical protein